jgi:acetyl-CoA carboxylase carboxyltransferase component
MGVSGPRILELALSETVTDEELGGWKVHGMITGMADRIADDEADCFDIIKQFLSYMPSNNQELPPRGESSPEDEGEISRILEILPQKRNRAYDMHRLLHPIFDRSSLFTIKPDFGKNVITALGRIKGRVAGIIANQPMFNAGAMDTDGIDKVISFICLCDSFNIPLIFFHDTPGFLVGRAAERNRVAARVMNFMNALGLVTVPKISIIVRKTYGMAFWNMAGSGCDVDFFAAWPTAEMSFVSPEIAANVVFGGKIPESERDKAQWENLVQQMVDDASPYGAAGAHYIHDVIDPRDTRDYIHRALEITQGSQTKGIGEHRLANWPTKF